MYLKTLCSQNFRICRDIKVTLQPDLTVLVSENSGGKYNLVNTIRLLTYPLNGRIDRYPEEQDISRKSSSLSWSKDSGLRRNTLIDRNPRWRVKLHVYTALIF
jgi:recombinational DNA repair ATPase RecF